MAIDSGGGGAKKPRVDEQGDRSEAVDADADRISALPDELRQRILTHLSFKDAIRTGALARGWRDVWKSRWAHRSSVEIHLCSHDALRRELDALAREPRPRCRLDRFSLVADNRKLKSLELQRFIKYAAECRVVDLHVDLRNTANGFAFRLPLCSPLLMRLSLRRMCIANRFYKGAQPFRALEFIQLQTVSIYRPAFHKMMSLCPSLLTLYLCDCIFTPFVNLFMPPNLRNVTMKNCVGMLRLQGQRSVPSLRSFRYRGEISNIVMAPFSLPRDAVLADLYIQFARSVSEQDLKKNLSNSLPKDLSGLNVLTICCKALRVAFSFTNDGANAQLPNLNLHNLRELQLLMLEMEATNLADIYVFFKICQCRNLERLFVQLPEFSYQPTEGSIDEVWEEPPVDGLDNLATVKVMNFNWRWAEVQLVSFLLRKAKSLQKLLIVSPNVTPPNAPGVDEADLFYLKEALANGKIMLSDSDDTATQPYHSEVFIEL
ncbi:unnamed protein product [Urochloa decumbens]|uniref:F-box domain-containing protein n=1 Tax=Urochloa decumbens TaxID=240449 RepID=A0ABC9E0M7_9POAL